MAELQKLDAAWLSLRWALHIEPELGSQEEKLLQAFLVERRLRELPPDWLHVGCFGDVPAHAAYKSHCGGTWVWVCPDGIRGLSELTLIILDIGTVDLTSVPAYIGNEYRAPVDVKMSSSGPATGPSISIEVQKQLAHQLRVANPYKTICIEGPPEGGAKWLAVLKPGVPKPFDFHDGLAISTDTKKCPNVTPKDEAEKHAMKDAEQVLIDSAAAPSAPLVNVPQRLK
jgi:hypothetical protein